MKVNLEKAQKIFKRTIKKSRFKKIPFDFEVRENSLGVSAAASYGDIDFNISMQLFDSGEFFSGIIFDELNTEQNVLELLNFYNNENIIFKLYVDEDGVLNADNIIYSKKAVSILKWLIRDFFRAIPVLCEDETITKLVIAKK